MVQKLERSVQKHCSLCRFNDNLMGSQVGTDYQRIEET